MPEKLKRSYAKALETKTYGGSLSEWVSLQHLLYKTGYSGQTQPLPRARWLLGEWEK